MVFIFNNIIDLELIVDIFITKIKSRRNSNDWYVRDVYLFKYSNRSSSFLRQDIYVPNYLNNMIFFFKRQLNMFFHSDLHLFSNDIINDNKLILVELSYFCKGFFVELFQSIMISYSLKF